MFSSEKVVFLNLSKTGLLKTTRFLETALKSSVAVLIVESDLSKYIFPGPFNHRGVDALYGLLERKSKLSQEKEFPVHSLLLSCESAGGTLLLGSNDSLNNHVSFIKESQTYRSNQLLTHDSDSQMDSDNETITESPVRKEKCINDDNRVNSFRPEGYRSRLKRCRI